MTYEHRTHLAVGGFNLCKPCYFLNECIIQARTFMCVCTVALGGCFAYSVAFVNGVNRSDGTNPLSDYYKLALAGEVISLLSFVSSLAVEVRGYLY